MLGAFCLESVTQEISRIVLIIFCSVKGGGFTQNVRGRIFVKFAQGLLKQGRKLCRAKRYVNEGLYINRWLLRSKQLGGLVPVL